ncbi:MAG TPA: uridine diphosphate-N-acetylglucosamine-binding protein YvcK, partial [Asanoa sp.]|nr:uridine diphosphate-N-acetylglucosamine-binding protein YvcK [Asanoa sp.]
MRIVAFGGGHGLSASLRALRGLGTDLDITAVVTVADDGGSSGRLRAERAALPPGDLRQALAALAAERPDTRATAELFQHRFAPDGRDHSSLDGHTVGNLVLVGLMEQLGDPVSALDHAARMVDAAGRVLPMAVKAVGIEADVRGADPRRPQTLLTVVGQHAVAVAPGHVEAVRLTPADPPACPEAVAAVERADWLIFGPGSWYTSVIPHLLVPDLAAAIVASPARRLVTLNLAAEPETWGLSAADHLAALHWYLPGLKVDTVLADGTAVGDP